MIEHRESYEGGSTDKTEGVFPVSFQERLIGKKQGWKEKNEYERGDAHRDIRVEAEAKYHTRDEKIMQASGSQSSEKEVKGKSQDKCRHDGAEADARKVDRPVGCGKHEGTDNADSAPMEELFPEEVYAEH